MFYRVQGLKIHGFGSGTVALIPSLLQQPGPKKFKLFKIELICKAKKFQVPPFTI